jgi:hypothetical protein
VSHLSAAKLARPEKHPPGNQIGNTLIILAGLFFDNGAISPPDNPESLLICPGVSCPLLDNHSKKIDHREVTNVAHIHQSRPCLFKITHQKGPVEGRAVCKYLGGKKSSSKDCQCGR